ncbi:MAG: hypothetical protein NT150_00605 [Bacteroidetes bacterium]|nr:hypothetical protein [Bacteroidota bacterium]
MDAETASYIINYFSHLLTDVEKKALRHHSSLIKTKNLTNEALIKMYYKKEWLSTDQSVLELLKDGYGNFELNVACRVLLEHAQKVFLNLCPRCNKLARTPQAKQCRHCQFDWHLNSAINGK